MRSPMSAAKLMACERYSAVRPAPSPWPYRAAIPIMPTDRTTSETIASIKLKPTCCECLLLIGGYPEGSRRTYGRNAGGGDHQQGGCDVGNLVLHLPAARGLDANRARARQCRRGCRTIAALVAVQDARGRIQANTRGATRHAIRSESDIARVRPNVDRAAGYCSA